MYSNMYTHKSSPLSGVKYTLHTIYNEKLNAVNKHKLPAFLIAPRLSFPTDLLKPHSDEIYNFDKDVMIFNELDRLHKLNLDDGVTGKIDNKNNQIKTQSVEEDPFLCLEPEKIENKNLKDDLAKEKVQSILDENNNNVKEIPKQTIEEVDFLKDLLIESNDPFQTATLNALDDKDILRNIFSKNLDQEIEPENNSPTETKDGMENFNDIWKSIGGESESPKYDKPLPKLPKPVEGLKELKNKFNIIEDDFTKDTKLNVEASDHSTKNLISLLDDKTNRTTSVLQNNQIQNSLENLPSFSIPTNTTTDFKPKIAVPTRDYTPFVSTSNLQNSTLSNKKSATIQSVLDTTWLENFDEKEQFIAKTLSELGYNGTFIIIALSAHQIIEQERERRRKKLEKNKKSKLSWKWNESLKKKKKSFIPEDSLDETILLLTNYIEYIQILVDNFNTTLDRTLNLIILLNFTNVELSKIEPILKHNKIHASKLEILTKIEQMIKRKKNQTFKTIEDSSSMEHLTKISIIDEINKFGIA